MTSTEWPRFAAVLHEHAREERDRRVRRMAKRAAEVLESLDPNARPQPAPSDDLFPADNAAELYTVAMHELDKVIAQYAD
jgi:hypothetical protein